MKGRFLGLGYMLLHRITVRLLDYFRIFYKIFPGYISNVSSTVEGQQGNAVLVMTQT